MATWDELRAELEVRLAAARAMGGPERIARERERGKSTARERVDMLLDAGSFDEWGAFAHHQEQSPDMVNRSTPSDGLVCGQGRIGGRLVCVAADDATVMGGSRGLAAEAKQSHLRRAAIGSGVPFIWLQEASGGRIQELMGASFAARTFATNFSDQVQRMSGWIPQVSALLGACFGQPAFVSGLAEFVPMSNLASVGASGPPVVAAAIGERSSEQELGGPQIALAQGLVDGVYAGDKAVMDAIRAYLGYFPSNSGSSPPIVASSDPVDRQCPELESIVPTNLRQPYDMRKVIKAVCDADSEFFEIGEGNGPQMIVGYARIGGISIGIVANQPKVQAGVISATAARKASRFIQVCDAFHIPLVFLVDTPGFMVGAKAEREGLAAGAARMLSAILEATVPTLTVILRKSYGLGFFAMNGACMSPDTLLTWPTASISQMGPEPAVNVIHAKQIQAAADPDALRAELVEQLRQDIARPYKAAGTGAIDNVIDPRATRAMLARRLVALTQRPASAIVFKRRIPPR
ncbi:MAG: acyl-CoA carboxylase subunit beta [Reyranellaceae bacterium]